MADKDEYYSIPEAARTCGVSRATMWNWVKSGKIHAFVTPGGHHRIRREEMDRLVAENRFAKKAPPPPQRLLVVDDDPAVRKFFQRRLSQNGYQVETAENGFKAGIIVSQRQPDLVLLDLFMEGMDGFEVCRTIKGDPTLKKIKVLAISGDCTPRIQRRIESEGADGFLSKDADFETVLTQIKIMLNQQ